jgi:hypothetical protein
MKFMKKQRIYLLVCLIAILSKPALFAQVEEEQVIGNEVVSPLYHNALQKKITSTVNVSRDETPLNLPFVEDFSRNRFPGGGLPEPLQFWIDNDAYRNYTYPKDPITFWVATLDGLAEDGMPYNFTNPTAYGIADHLTSKSINLVANANDSVYFSFFYQGGGLGNNPEVADSLILEFYSPLNDSWVRQWATQGKGMDEFELVMIRIIEDMFLQPGFRFRFKNYATLSGSFDHWHLDYIMLDRNRSINDTLPRDVAFTHGFKGLLNGFTSVPWSHYKENSSFFMIDSIKSKIFNHDDGLKNIVNAGMQIRRVRDNNLEWDIPYISNTFNLDPLTEFELGFPIGSADIPVTLNTLIPDTFVDYEVLHYATNATPPERLTSNDTIRIRQTFADYYAYDDGSAEAAYGINLNGSVAVRFTPLMPDTIIGAYIHFAPARRDTRDFGFFLTVWNSINPEVLNFRNFDFSYPQYVNEFDSITGRNQFLFYKFDQPIYVDGEFFLGWTKPEPESLNWGFDLNNDNSNNTFFSLGLDWQGSQQQGAIMIRPAFKSEINILSVEPSDESPVLLSQIFPNPTSEKINIIWAEPRHPHQILVYNQQGKLLKKYSGYNSNTINLSDCGKGLIFLEITDEITKNKTVAKVIVN